MRGFDCIPFTQRAAQGTSVRWGGAGGFEGDRFRVPIAWERGAELVLGASPAIAWASAPAPPRSSWCWTLSRWAGLAPAGLAIALLGTNGRRFVVEYAEDSAFTTPSRFHLDGYRATVLIDKLGDNRIVGDDPRTGGRRAGGGTPAPAVTRARCVEIIYTAGDVLELRYTGNQLDNGLIAGTTLVLWVQTRRTCSWTTEGVLVRSSTAGLTSVYPRFMRVTIDGDATGPTADEHWQLGRLQAGLAAHHVPMDWSTQDDDETRTWICRPSPAASARPTVKGRSRHAGGHQQGRRGSLADRSAARCAWPGYSQHPVLLCTDDQQLRRSLYARLSSSTELANAGWRYNRDSKRWEQVGVPA